VMRAQLGWINRTGKVCQPWAIPEEKIEHTMHLRFTVQAALDIENVKLAVEDADLAEVKLNGEIITAKPDGWFCDKSIGTILLGKLQKGENIMELALPFGKRIGAEWCYLLGNFGVHVMGQTRVLVPMQEKLGFDTVTVQGLAHYGSNITYSIPVTTHGGKLRVHVPHYAGAAVRVEIDGKRSYIVYPPYRAVFEDLEAGEHKLDIVLLGNRQNAFGPVHLADAKRNWIGPDAWRTAGSWWTESYRLKPIGLLSAPILEELK